MATPIQIITIEMKERTVRVMVEKPYEGLYRAYFSYQWDGKYEAYIFSGIERASHLSLLTDCVALLSAKYGDVVGGNNEISDIYKHDEIENILGVTATKS